MKELKKIVVLIFLNVLMFFQIILQTAQSAVLEVKKIAHLHKLMYLFSQKSLQRSKLKPRVN